MSSIVLVFLIFLIDLFTFASSVPVNHHTCFVDLTKSDLESPVALEPIIKFGKVSPQWIQMTNKTYIADKNTDLEYFYFVSTLPNKTFVEKINTIIESSNASYAKPIVNEIKTVSQIHSALHQEAYEVKYNCQPNIDQKVLITLTVNVNSCKSPFILTWVKHCQPRDYPSISIGLAKNKFDIMLSGKFNTQNKDIYKDSQMKEEKMRIPKEMTSLRLFLTNTGVANDILMEKPRIIVNSNNLQVLTTGHLGKGGYLRDKSLDIQLNFICMNYKISTNDIQVSFMFKSFDPINLFFEKKCDTIAEIQEYFTILFTIYWVILFAMIMILICVVMYYFNVTQFSLFNFLKCLYDFACCTKKSKYEHSEEEAINLKACEKGINLNNDSAKSESVDSNNNRQSYGGI